MHLEGYYVEHNGDCWQSVFPKAEAHLSQCHATVEDAVDYMVNECGKPQPTVLPRKD